MWFMRGILGFTLALAFSRHHGCVLGSYSEQQLRGVQYNDFAPNIGGSQHASNPWPTYHDQRNVINEVPDYALTFISTPFSYMNGHLVWTRFSYFLLDTFANAVNSANRAFVEYSLSGPVGTAAIKVVDAFFVGVGEAVAKFLLAFKKGLIISKNLVFEAVNFLGRESVKYIKSTAFEKLDNITTEYLSRSGGKPDSDISRKHHLLLKKLKSTTGSVNAVAQYALYNLASLVGIGTVYLELFGECREDKGKLDYTVVQGESFTEERYLNEVINKANVNRREACQFYKSQFGDNPIYLLPFIVGRYIDILSTIYGDADLPSDVRLIDSVVQNMMGRVEPECIMSFLCKAGLAKIQDKPHPGVDLLLGMLVDGYTDLGIIYNQPYVPKLGTPKMAEAIYKGYMNDCDEFKMQDLECWRRDVEEMSDSDAYQTRVESSHNEESNRTEKDEL